MKKLVFDVTDANTIADSDSVGAFLRSSDGTLITHTTVGGKEALDVRIAEGINVEVDLDAADDSVAAYLNDGAGNAIGSTGGAIHVSDAGGSLTVDAVDLDIRDLTQTDEITAYQGGVWNIGTLTSITNDVNIADGGNSITVDAVDLDIRDLTFATDQVQIGNATGVADFGAGNTSAQTLRVALADDTSLEVNDAALADTAILSSANTLDAANTAESVVASALANRKYLWVHNYDNREMFIGGAGVTSANGFPLSPSMSVELRAGAAVDVNYVSVKASHAIRTLELS